MQQPNATPYVPGSQDINSEPPLVKHGGTYTNYVYDESSDPGVAKIQRLLKVLGEKSIIVNRLDYYGNGIPIGAFCFFITFFVKALWDLKCISVTYSQSYDGTDPNDSQDKSKNTYADKDLNWGYYEPFLAGLIIAFGGLGQITASLLEFLKGRAFPSTIYMIFGIYLLVSSIGDLIYQGFISSESIYFFEYFKPGGDDPTATPPISNLLFFSSGTPYKYRYLCTAFQGVLLFLNLGTIIGSLKTNVMYVVQAITMELYFIFKLFGIRYLKKAFLNFVPGIFEMIASLVSFYIFANQMINEQKKYLVLPPMALCPDNEIDINEEDSNRMKERLAILDQQQQPVQVNQGIEYNH